MVGRSLAGLRVVALGSLLPLAACAMPPPEPSATVHVADIINSVKCGLAGALMSDTGHRRLPGTIAQVELQLKVVDTRGFSANSPSATGPVILGWYGPAVLPSLTGSNQQSFTVDTTINLTYRLDGPNIAACSAAGVDPQDRFGLARWLGDIVIGLSKVSSQGPRGTLDRLTYDATFAVTRDAGVGGSVKIVFIDAGANVNRSRSDTQHLRLVISGPNSIVSTLDDASRTAPVKPGAIPNLSTSAPVPR